MKAPVKKILFKSNTTYSISVYKENEISVPWHLHASPQILFSKGLKGMLLLGKRIETITEDNIFFIASNLPHSYKFSKKTKGAESSYLNIIYLNTNKIKSLSQNFAEFQSLRQNFNNFGYSFNVTKKEARKFPPLFDDIEGKSQLDQALHVFKILDVLGSAKKLKILSSPNLSINDNPKEERMNKILAFTYENFTNPVELNDVAEMVHLTKESFCRYFKQKTNQTYISFLLELRINFACQKLQFTNYTIKDIAYESGFSNVPHFNNHFRKIMNMTPSEFRKLNL